jgi:hypothetical protein
MSKRLLITEDNPETRELIKVPRLMKVTLRPLPDAGRASAICSVFSAFDRAGFEAAHHDVIGLNWVSASSEWAMCRSHHDRRR